MLVTLISTFYNDLKKYLEYLKELWENKITAALIVGTWNNWPNYYWKL